MKPRQLSIHPSVERGQTFIKRLPEVTGHTLEEWHGLLRQQPMETHRERVQWLKEKHSVGSNYADLVSATIDGGGRELFEESAYLEIAQSHVENLFSGPKSSLVDIYDGLLDLAIECCPQLRVSPCKTFVPLYRHHVFAQLKPTTLTRIDLGLALGDQTDEGPLISTGGFAKKDRITHRIAFTNPGDINATVRKWLVEAYERDC